MSLIAVSKTHNIYKTLYLPIIMIKEEKSNDNSSGVASLVFGVLSTLFCILIIPSIILGILGISFGINQRRKSNNKWALTGIILSVIGIILSILLIWMIYNLITQTQQILESCIANPALPGCKDILKLLPQDQLQNVP